MIRGICQFCVPQCFNHNIIAVSSVMILVVILWSTINYANLVEYRPIAGELVRLEAGQVLVLV